VARGKKGKGIRDPLEEGERKPRSSRAPTSRNREESMTESGNDEFQNPRTSGTTALGGESRDAGSGRGAGGVEGTSEET
jgi:hypothetical protein